MTHKLSPAQLAVLRSADKLGRVWPAHHSNPNAPGRGGPARAMSRFRRTAEALVRRGLLVKVHEPGRTGYYQLTDLARELSVS